MYPYKAIEGNIRGYIIQLINYTLTILKVFKTPYITSYGNNKKIKQKNDFRTDNKKNIDILYSINIKQNIIYIMHYIVYNIL